MKARATHIDINPGGSRAAGLLAAVASPRPVNLPCRPLGPGRMLVSIPRLGVDLVIEAPGAPACREAVHVAMHHGHLTLHPR